MLAAHKHPTPTIQMCLDGRSVVLVTFMFLGTAALGILLSIDRSMDIGYIFVFLLKYLISLKKVKFHKKRKICKLFVRRVHLFFRAIFFYIYWCSRNQSFTWTTTEKNRIRRYHSTTCKVMTNFADIIQMFFFANFFSKF